MRHRACVCVYVAPSDHESRELVVVEDLVRKVLKEHILLLLVHVHPWHDDVGGGG
jgi:hypothetical protein